MMRIGILFGGQAREREISFAGGKTAMAHINKALFKPVPIFVDSLGHFILIKESLIFEESIRDFFPPKQYQTAPFLVYIESLENQEYDFDVFFYGVIIQFNARICASNLNNFI